MLHLSLLLVEAEISNASGHLFRIVKPANLLRLHLFLDDSDLEMMMCIQL